MSAARELIREVRRQAAAHESPSPAMAVALADALERALDANVALRARLTTTDQKRVHG